MLRAMSLKSSFDELKKMPGRTLLALHENIVWGRGMLSVSIILSFLMAGFDLFADPVF